MACQIVSVDGAVFVLWGKPSRIDLDRVITEVERVANASRQPVVFITRIPKDAPAPEGDARTHLNKIMPRFIKVCASYHAVLEGSGFVSAIKRAVLAGLLQFGFRSGTFFVHDTDQKVIEKVAPHLVPNVQTLLALVGKKGLLTAPPPLD